MTPELILPALTLAGLLYACRVFYRDAKAREAMDRAAALRVESMDKAMTDMNGRCWICTEEAGWLELVDAGARFELACVPCAEATKLVTRRAA